MGKDHKAELQKLVDRFKRDVNGVVLHMLTDALGGSARTPAKRGGDLLRAELEGRLTASAQTKPTKPAKRKPDQRAYQKAWRLRRKKRDGGVLSKTQENWLKRYDARNK